VYKHRTIAGIPAAEILRLRPGDILALTFSDALDRATLADIADNLKDVMPDGVQSVILDRDAKFQVIRTSKDDGS
jgi:hypothetical protein